MLHFDVVVLLRGAAIVDDRHAVRSAQLDADDAAAAQVGEALDRAIERQVGDVALDRVDFGKAPGSPFFLGNRATLNGDSLTRPSGSMSNLFTASNMLRDVLSRMNLRRDSWKSSGRSGAH